MTKTPFGNVEVLTIVDNTISPTRSHGRIATTGLVKNIKGCKDGSLLWVRVSEPCDFEVCPEGNIRISRFRTGSVILISEEVPFKTYSIPKKGIIGFEKMGEFWQINSWTTEEEYNVARNI